MAYVNFKNSPSEETPLTGGATGNLNVMQENGTSHGTDTKLGYAQSFLNEHIVNVSNEVDEDYKVSFVKSNNLLPNLSASGTTNGVSWAIVGNKLTLNGTASADTTIYLYGSWGNETTLSRLKVGTYNFNVSGSTAYNKLALWLITRASGTTSYLAQLQKANEEGNIAFTINSEKPITGVYITFSNGTTFTNDVYYLQINEGSITLPYEPYITPSIYVGNEEIYSKSSYASATDYTAQNITGTTPTPIRNLSINIATNGKPLCVETDFIAKTANATYTALVQLFIDDVLKVSRLTTIISTNEMYYPSMVILNDIPAGNHKIEVKITGENANTSITIPSWYARHLNVWEIQ